MFEKAGKRKISMLMAPVSLAAGLLLGTLSANAGTYVTSSTGETVYGGFKECWKAASGTTKNVPYCGDVISTAAQPEPIPTQRDSDSDGVVDAIDQCPGSLYGAIVNSFGCFVDQDNDGVADSQDRCPGSVTRAKVDDQGCVQITASTGDSLRFVLGPFALNKANTLLKNSADKAELGRIAQKIKAFQTQGTKRIHILGYTDSIGPEGYNLKLSERRAQTVADYLAGKGVRNITVKGMGETAFIGDNNTLEGRAKNRRIEIIAQ